MCSPMNCAGRSIVAGVANIRTSRPVHRARLRHLSKPFPSSQHRGVSPGFGRSAVIGAALRHVRRPIHRQPLAQSSLGSAQLVGRGSRPRRRDTLDLSGIDV
jgi:hypothetical protein